MKADGKKKLNPATSGAGYRALTAAALLGLLLSLPAQAVLNENCVVSVLNRTVQVKTDGSWVLPNIPANMGAVRARATCVENGLTTSGQSAYFTIPANGSLDVPPIIMGNATPIPTSVTVAAATTRLTQPGQSVQLDITAIYPDSTTKPISAASTNTQYLISNPALASITADGLVTARASGTVIVQAVNEGTQGILQLNLSLSADSDGDGIPDDVEQRFGMDANNPTDALDDPDHDGLTNLQEYQHGTELTKADTDGDGLSDGDEINGTSGFFTNPLLADTDADGIPDNVEVVSGSDPTNAASMNLAGALKGITVTPNLFYISISSLQGQGFVQLKVTGEFKLGGTIDLTSLARGTNYSSDKLPVCNFGAENGRVYGGIDGTCSITVSNNGFSAKANGTVRNFTPAAISWLSIPGYANNVDVAGNYAYIAAGSTGLQVVDVSNKSSPVIVSSADTPGNAYDVRVVGNLAFIADGSFGLRIFDISNPLSPALAGSVDTAGVAYDVVVSGNRAYVADGTFGLVIIDITNPTTPSILGTLDTVGTANGVDVSGNIAVVADGARGIQIIDVSDSALPVWLGGLATTDARDVTVDGGIAYLADYTGSLRVIDFTTPSAPRLLATTSGTLGGYLWDVAKTGNFVFGADVYFVNGVPIVNASNPNSPVVSTRLDFNQWRDDNGTGIAADGQHVYLTAAWGVIGKGALGNTRLYIGQYLGLGADRNGVSPTISLASPTDGASVIQGAKLTLRANATDDVNVFGVTFNINGVDVFTDTSAPYEMLYTVPLDATNLTIVARAYDLGNNTAATAPVSVAAIPDPLTTITGRVIRQMDQTAAAGATVTCSQNLTATTGSDGTFTIAGAATILGNIACEASIVENGATLRGSSSAVPPVPAGTADVGTIAVVENKRVGYYDLSWNRGNPAQVGSILAAGLEAADVGNLVTANLNDFGILFVQNPNNGGYSWNYTSNLNKVFDFVAGGGVLVFHDRCVTNAGTMLPGTPGTITREFSDPANIQIVDSTTLVAKGPGGTLTNTSLDGGNYSSHGSIAASSIPANGKGLLSKGDPAKLVLYAYPYGRGWVLYSTIPLDHYLAGSGGVAANMKNVYAPNVLSYAASMRGKVAP
jgi:hypothetical protein